MGCAVFTENLQTVSQFVTASVNVGTWCHTNELTEAPLIGAFHPGLRTCQSTADFSRLALSFLLSSHYLRISHLRLSHLLQPLGGVSILLSYLHALWPLVLLPCEIKYTIRSSYMLSHTGGGMFKYYCAKENVLLTFIWFKSSSIEVRSLFICQITAKCQIQQ